MGFWDGMRAVLSLGAAVTTAAVMTAAVVVVCERATRPDPAAERIECDRVLRNERDAALLEREAVRTELLMERHDRIAAQLTLDELRRAGAAGIGRGEEVRPEDRIPAPAEPFPLPAWPAPRP